MTDKPDGHYFRRCKIVSFKKIDDEIDWFNFTSYLLTGEGKHFSAPFFTGDTLEASREAAQKYLDDGIAEAEALIIKRQEAASKRQAKKRSKK